MEQAGCTMEHPLYCGHFALYIEVWEPSLTIFCVRLKVSIQTMTCNFHIKPYFLTQAQPSVEIQAHLTCIKTRLISKRPRSHYVCCNV